MLPRGVPLRLQLSRCLAEALARTRVDMNENECFVCWMCWIEANCFCCLRLRSGTASLDERFRSLRPRCCCEREHRGGPDDRLGVGSMASPPPPHPSARTSLHTPPQPPSPPPPDLDCRRRRHFHRRTFVAIATATVDTTAAAATASSTASFV